MKKLIYILVALSVVLSCSSGNKYGGNTGSSNVSVPAGNYNSGKASWYGNEFNGRKTASGDIFNEKELTAAHQTLPFGTIVEVTNKTNNKKVRVKINDRGPHTGNRIIDLSKESFSRIADPGTGIIDVTIKVIK